MTDGQGRTLTLTPPLDTVTACVVPISAPMTLWPVRRYVRAERSQSLASEPLTSALACQGRSRCFAPQTSAE